jgi:L-threonylcarbamoyladenylate synthase
MLKTISLTAGGAASLEDLERAADVLREEGLICLPCGGEYRLVAPLDSEMAVQRLFAAKRRTKTAPTLVFVSDGAMLALLAPDLPETAQRLADRLWPGPLTLLVAPELPLPNKLVKRMCKHRGKIGVRVPQDDVARALIEAFGGPILVSSANLEKKAGAYSAAQVRKNFLNAVELFLDAGDLTPAPHSTVVDVDDEHWEIVRPGALDQAALEAALAG